MARATLYPRDYACIAASLANLVGASIGAGDSIVPIAGGGTAAPRPRIDRRHPSAQRRAAFIVTSLLVLWGLRLPPLLLRGHRFLDRLDGRPCRRLESVFERGVE
jgi:hypothetical protein